MKRTGSVHRGRWLVHLVLAIVVGAAGGALGVAWLHHHRHTARAALDFPPRSDGLGDILAGLRSDGVYVAPDGTDILDAAGAAKVRAAVAASPIPVYVAVIPPGQHLGVDESQIGQALADELPDRHGVLFLWQGPRQGDIEILGTYGGDVPGFDTIEDFVGDPAITLATAVRHAARTDFYSADDSRSNDYWGGVPGGSVLGVLIALGVLVVMLVVTWLTSTFLGRRLPGHWSWREDSP